MIEAAAASVHAGTQTGTHTGTPAWPFAGLTPDEASKFNPQPELDAP